MTQPTASAFLIYVDPEHPTNRVCTLVLAQGCAVRLGFGLALSLLVLLVLPERASLCLLQWDRHGPASP